MIPALFIFGGGLVIFLGLFFWLEIARVFGWADTVVLLALMLVGGAMIGIGMADWLNG